MFIPMIPFMEMETGYINFDDYYKKKVKINESFIYLEKDGKILKFKVTPDPGVVIYAIRKYIDEQKQEKLEILNKKEILKREVPLQFYQYLGKFRLEQNILKTKNYLVPEKSPMLELLGNKYKDNIVTNKTLKRLEQIKIDAMVDENILDLKIIDLLLENLNIYLSSEYNTNRRQLNDCIDNVDKLLYSDKEVMYVLKRLKFILETSKENKKYINKLGLKDKFDEAFKRDNEKQKVKS